MVWAIIYILLFNATVFQKIITCSNSPVCHENIGWFTMLLQKYPNNSSLEDFEKTKIDTIPVLRHVYMVYNTRRARELYLRSLKDIKSYIYTCMIYKQNVIMRPAFSWRINTYAASRSLNQLVSFYYRCMEDCTHLMLFHCTHYINFHIDLT